MLIPGSNILNVALNAINPTGGVTVRYYTGETENEYGTTVKTYTEATPLVGCSVQPASFTIINQLGLDVNRKYVNIWTQKDVRGVYEGHQGDLIQWDGANWEVTAETSWIVQDGWKQIMAVRQ